MKKGEDRLVRGRNRSSRPSSGRCSARIGLARVGTKASGSLPQASSASRSAFGGRGSQSWRLLSGRHRENWSAAELRNAVNANGRALSPTSHRFSISTAREPEVARPRRYPSPSHSCSSLRSAREAPQLADQPTTRSSIPFSRGRNCRPRPASAAERSDEPARAPLQPAPNLRLWNATLRLTAEGRRLAFLIVKTYAGIEDAALAG
jgi:hypothetical protein